MLCNLSPADLKRINSSLSRLISTGRWATVIELCALGVFLQVRGAPRLPLAIIDTVGLLSWLRDGALAPVGQKSRGPKLLRYVRQWARRLETLRGTGCSRGDRGLKDRIIALGNPSEGAVGPVDLQRIGTAVYEAAWHRADNGNFKR